MIAQTVCVSMCDSNEFVSTSEFHVRCFQSGDNPDGHTLIFGGSETELGRKHGMHLRLFCQLSNF